MHAPDLTAEYIRDAARLLQTHHTPEFAYTDPEFVARPSLPPYVHMFSAFSAFFPTLDYSGTAGPSDILRIFWMSDRGSRHSIDIELRSINAISLSVRNNNDPPNAGYGEGLVMRAGRVRYLNPNHPSAAKDLADARRLLGKRAEHARSANGIVLASVGHASPAYYAADVTKIMLNPQVTTDTPVSIPLTDLKGELYSNQPEWWK